MRRLIEQLVATEATFSVFEADVAQKLRRRRREVYARPQFIATGQWVCQDFDWHTFSNGYTPALEESRALEAYSQRPAGTVWLLSDGEMIEEFRASEIVVRATFDRAPLPNLQQRGSDLLVVDVDFAWTMAFTHEVGWYGPYFATAADAAAAARRLEAERADALTRGAGSRGKQY